MQRLGLTDDYKSNSDMGVFHFGGCACETTHSFVYHREWY